VDTSLARDLLDYIAASPSPFHAASESARRLEAAGFRRVAEGDDFQLQPGERIYLIRDGATLAAFELGSQPPEEAGFRIIGAHTDSPSLRVKPQPELSREGYRQLAVEPYGGVLYSTWLDRDLSLAGRVVVRTQTGVACHLLALPGAPLRIPNLAIHLNRGVNDKLALNAQQHLVPILGLGEREGFSLRALLCAQLSSQAVQVEPEAVLGWDLCLVPVEPGRLGGVDDELLCSARLDNLAGCHGALSALLGTAGAAHTRGIVLFDHEEVGSQSARGASSLLLRSLLSRILAAYGAESETRLARAVAKSVFVSSDMAHGVHPNYADRHEPAHRPVLGAGPVIKFNANQAYSTDGETWALFERLAAAANAQVQRFVVRSDLGCGSTIGPITAARLGIRCVDVGNPMLGMHSARETAATADVEPMIRVLRAFLEHG
jgi:aspartyl aminopeptidase